MLRIKKNDTVSIIAGKDKGKKGKVLSVSLLEHNVLVEGLNLVKKARRRTQQDQKGGIVDIEAPIHLSNVMLICKQCNKPVRVRFSVLKDKSKIRECKSCGASI